MLGKSVLFALGLAVAGAAGHAVAEPTVLRMSIWEPPGSWGSESVYKPWIEAVEAASNGTLKIELYEGASLGKAVDQFENISNGVVSMGPIVPSFTPGRFQYNEIGELPLLWSDPRVAGMASNGMVQKGLLEYPGVKVIATWVTAPYQLHGTKPMNTIDDLRGMKLRAAGPIYGQLMEKVGAVPVGIPTPDVAEALSRGVLDGTMNDWTLAQTFRMLDVANHHLDVALGGVIAFMGVNQDVYDGLPDEAKAALDQYGWDYLSKLWGGAVNAETQKIVAAIEADPKHTIVRPDAAEMARWQETLQPIIDGWAATSPEHARRLEAFKAELASARERLGE